MCDQGEKQGFFMNVGAELEYYLFRDDKTPEPLDEVGYFDLTPSHSAMPRPSPCPTPS